MSVTTLTLAQASAPGSLLQGEVLIYFYALAAPGLVALMVYDLLVPTQRRDFSTNLIQALTFGGINLALWAWVGLVDLATLAQDHPVRFYILALAALLVSPSVLAYGLYRLRNAKFLEGRITSTAPTGWDAFFGKGKSCLILFHMKGGQKIGGLFADASDASTFPNVQQVYVEQFWKLDDQYNLLEPIPRTLGGIIDKSDCDYVEFLNLGNLQDEDTKGDEPNDEPNGEQTAQQDQGD